MQGSSKWSVLLILSIAIALISIDGTIVNVSLPSMQSDLNATTSELQWIVDAYSITLAGTLLVAGSLGDRFGRRRVLMLGLAIFILGSLTASFADSAQWLVLCRAIMGIGAACILPSALGIVVQVFQDRDERAIAIGVWSAVAGVGVAVGPILGGLLVENFSWRAAFLVSPPIAAAVLVAVLARVPESFDPSRPKLDPLGALLSSLGLALLITFIIELPGSGVNPVTVGLILAAVVLLTTFVWWEGRAERPILPMALFRNRTFSTAVALVGLVYFSLMGAMFFLPQFLQLVQGMGPLQSGFAMLPGALGLLVGSLLSPRLAGSRGARTVVVGGLGLVVLGLLAFTVFSPSTPYLVIGLSFGMVGFGLGLTLPQATNAVLASVPRERAGMGSACNDVMVDLGGAFGVAVLGAVMAATYRNGIDQAITSAGPAAQALPADVLESARSSLSAALTTVRDLPAEYAGPFRDVAGQAFVQGMSTALLIGAGITAVGLLVAWTRFPRQVEAPSED